jgi:Flp pilus assembly protein TadD
VRGRLRAELSGLGSALDAYRERVAAAPHEARAHLDLARAYRDAGLVDRARVEYLATALLDPTSAAEHLGAYRELQP